MSNEQLDARMDRLEKQISQGFKRMDERLTSIETGIQGNKEHDQPGYKERIMHLERRTKELNEFKKKITWIASFVAAVISSIVALIFKLL